MVKAMHSSVNEESICD